MLIVLKIFVIILLVLLVLKAFFPIKRKKPLIIPPTIYSEGSDFDIDTGRTWVDSEGNIFPILYTKNSHRPFVVKMSKVSKKKYRYYLPHGDRY